MRLYNPTSCTPMSSATSRSGSKKAVLPRAEGASERPTTTSTRKSASISPPLSCLKSISISSQQASNQECISWTTPPSFSGTGGTTRPPHLNSRPKQTGNVCLSASTIARDKNMIGEFTDESASLTDFSACPQLTSISSDDSWLERQSSTSENPFLEDSFFLPVSTKTTTFAPIDSFPSPPRQCRVGKPKPSRCVFQSPLRNLVPSGLSHKASAENIRPNRDRNGTFTVVLEEGSRRLRQSKSSGKVMKVKAQQHHKSIRNGTSSKKIDRPPLEKYTDMLQMGFSLDGVVQAMKRDDAEPSLIAFVQCASVARGMSSY